MSQAFRAVIGLAALSLFLVACDDDGGGPDPADGGSGEMCETPPLGCGMAEAVSGLPLEIIDRTDRGATDDFGGASCAMADGAMGGTGAPDLVYEFTAPEDGLYVFSTAGSSFDTVLSVRSGCAPADELACSDDISRGNQQSEVEVMLEACETVLVIVDGFDASASGSFVLEVTAQETMCGDGEDNDADGLMDCDDPDCFSLECNGGDDWPMDWQAFEWEVLELTNEARAVGHNCDTRGMFGPAPPLEMDMVVREAARGHALDMGEQDYFMHEGLDGRSASDRMRDAGYRGDPPWGENIATGQRTPREVVDGWLDSDGHCANIMNPSYGVLGVGYAFVESSMYGHQWVQNFGGSH